MFLVEAAVSHETVDSRCAWYSATGCQPSSTPRVFGRGGAAFGHTAGERFRGREGGRMAIWGHLSIPSVQLVGQWGNGERGRAKFEGSGSGPVADMGGQGGTRSQISSIACMPTVKGTGDPMVTM
eukprot:850097-Prorocentrum_minimum.AAC.2